MGKIITFNNCNRKNQYKEKLQISKKKKEGTEKQLALRRQEGRWDWHEGDPDTFIFTSGRTEAPRALLNTENQKMP